MILEHYHAVIMAGGGGTRLWPLSREKRPKQMLSLFDESTLFQTSASRLLDVFPPERIFVVTVRDQAENLRAQAPYIPAENFLLEPMPRGTAPVVGLAAVALQARDPQAIMAVLTADHYIGKIDRFHQLLVTAHDVAEAGHLVTLGIEPSFPATGFGYIQRGEMLGAYRGLDVYRVLRFKEKPAEDQARAMLEDGEHSWNSGMFVWKVETIMDEFKRQMPDLHRALQAIAQAWHTAERQFVIESVWPGIHPETIDYGIMEGANSVALIPAAGLEWSDVGSWDSLFDLLDCDENGNIVMGGEHVGLDTQQTLVYVDKTRRLIVTIGVNNLVLVDTGDVLLVCSKDQAQRVRQVVNQLKLQGRNYL
ncbi:MAG: NTP transferase domain-containing protein [Anaerolineales bacterium]|nr:NTP transferase domain-containing protein [Anaerolineales bacterium]